MTIDHGSRMDVKRNTGDTDEVVYDPPLDEGWDELTRLRWRAGLLHFDTGLDVKVKAEVPAKHGYGVSLPRSGTLRDLTFQDAWMYMAGLLFGYRAAKQEVTR